MNGGGRLRVAVIGAGPIGLEAALAATEAGYDVTVFESANRPAGNIRAWGHVRMFSPWEMNVSDRMRRHLAASGVPFDVDETRCPTGTEFVEALIDPLWARSAAASALETDSRVVSVGREGLLKNEEIATEERARHPFRLLIESSDGRERVERADVVLDCSGTYHNPNTLGDAGIPAPGERGAGHRITRRIPDLATEGDEWVGRTVLLAGSGHSAQTAARGLASLGDDAPGTRVLWVVRSENPDWGAVADDALEARRDLTGSAEAIGSGGSSVVEPRLGSVVDAVGPANGSVRIRLRTADGSPEEVEVDRVLSLTGAVGDHEIYRQLQVHECYATSGPMKLSAALLGDSGGDCLEQASHGVDTLKSPEPSFFLLGQKSYGRNNTFLLTVGWGQVAEVFQELAKSR